MLINREWLYQKYIVEQLSQLEVSTLAGVGHSTIQRKLKEFDIPTRTPWENRKGKKRSIEFKTKLAFLRIKNKTSISYLNNKDWLYKNHVIECRSVREIAKELEVDSKTLRKHMRQLEVPIRKHSDAILKGSQHPLFGRRGSSAVRWLGGKSFEPYCPKFNREFKERVREFWGRRCGMCGKTEKENGKLLCVHHVNYQKETCCDNSRPMFVALCVCCHTKTNGDRDYWKEYFTKMIIEKYNGKSYLSKTLR